MSTYMRFPETDKLSKQFWAYRPRNPSCGMISLERGSKLWLLTSLVACQIYAFRLAWLLFESQKLILSQKEKEDLKKLFISNPKAEIINLPEHPILEWFSKFIVCCLFGYYTWKLLKVIMTKDVPKLQTRFIIMCLINFIWFPMLYFEIMSWTDYLNLHPLLNFPAVGLTLVFQITGLMFTYSYISTLVKPPQEGNCEECEGNRKRNHEDLQDQGEVEEFNRV